MASPQFDAQLIEKVVREVLSALAATTSSASDGAKSAPAGQGTATSAPPSDQSGSGALSPPPGEVRPTALARIISTREGELFLPGRVITLTQVQDRIEGVRRLVLEPGAIITPAVKDLLQERRIPVFFGNGRSGRKDSDSSATRSQLTVLLVTRRITPEQMDHLLRPEGLTASYDVLECLLQTSEKAEELCQKGHLVVIVTRHVAPAVCLANRRRGVRAIAGRNSQDVTTDTTAVGANVLVADINAGLFGLKRMIRQFVFGSHICPEVFREKLELG